MLDVFQPTDVAWSKHFVTRPRHRSNVRTPDLSQIGGDRLAPANKTYTRLPNRVTLGFTPSDFFKFDRIMAIDERFTAITNGALDPFEKDMINQIATPTGIPNIYYMFVADTRIAYHDKLSDAEIEEVQHSLRPRDEPTATELLTYVSTTIDEVRSRFRSNADAVAALVEQIVRENPETAAKFGFDSADDVSTGAGETSISADQLNSTPLTIIMMAEPHLRLSEKSAMLATAYHEYVYVRVEREHFPPQVLVEQRAIADAVIRARADLMVSSYDPPSCIDELCGWEEADSSNHNIDSYLKMIVFDLRPHSTREADFARPGATWELTLPDDIHPDLADALNGNFTRCMDNLRVQDGFTNTRATSTVSQARLREADRGVANPDLTTALEVYDAGNRDSWIRGCEASVVDGVISYGVGVVAVNVNEETALSDYYYDQVHFSLAMTSAYQIEREDDPMVFGFTRAMVIADGLFLDPVAYRQINPIDRFVEISQDNLVDAYIQHYSNPEVIECGRYGALISFLKAAHHSTAANLKNTVEKLTGALQTDVDRVGIRMEVLFNLCLQFGTHTGSVRLSYARALNKARKNEISDAIRKRLHPDGPILSGPRNVYRTLMKIAATDYFTIMGKTQELDQIIEAMNRINAVGYRMTTYAQYMYGESTAPPEAAIAIISDAAIYAAAFAMVVPNSSIAKSAALGRMASQASSSDIMVQAQVEAYVKAYKRYIESVTTNSLVTKLGVNRNAISY